MQFMSSGRTTWYSIHMEGSKEGGDRGVQEKVRNIMNQSQWLLGEQALCFGELIMTYQSDSSLWKGSEVTCQ